MDTLNTNRELKPKQHIKLANQSLVFEAFGDTEKLTIAEITQRVNERLESHQKLSDQTVRRAIKDLCTSGLIRPYAKSNNAQTYGKLSAAMTSDEAAGLIPFGGQTLTVMDALKLFAEHESQPFKLKANLLSEQAERAIRREMLFVIMTAGSIGYEEALKKSAKRLSNVVAELEFALTSIRSFLDSPVWYAQYRDRIGYALRKAIESEPEVYKLADDYVKSGA